LRHVKEPWVHIPGIIWPLFPPIVPPLAVRGLPRVVDARGTWRPGAERLEIRGLYNKPLASATLVAVPPGGKSAKLDPKPNYTYLVIDVSEQPLCQIFEGTAILSNLGMPDL
jgi:hypothetical protein